MPLQKQTYPNLDLAKLICALLVVGIHTTPLSNGHPLAHFFVQNVLTRVAVPLFFAMSGFLFFGNLAYEDGRIAASRDNFSRLIRTTKRNLLLYTLWSVVYLLVQLPGWYATGWWGWAAVKDWIFAFLFSGAYYHLWYLLALVLAVPALYLLLRLIPVTKVWIPAAVLWVLECLTYSYAWVGVDKLPLVVLVGERMSVLFDAFFRAVPLLAIGAILSQRKNTRPGAAVCAVAFLLCGAEAFALYLFSPNEANFSYLFATPVMTWFVLMGLLTWDQLPLRKSQQFCLRDMSLTIYCIHPLLCLLCERWQIPSGIPFWLAVTVLSLAAAWLWSRRNRKA